MQLLEPGTPAAGADAARSGFVATYGHSPTVAGRAPGRVNLIGEHTDYNRGLCLPIALPHATYAAASPREDGLVRLHSRQSADGWQGSLVDAAPGRITGWPAYAAGVLWAMAESGLPVGGMDLYVDSRVPVGSGLSSSAALECAVAVAATQLAGLDLTERLRAQLAEVCVRAETEVAGAPTGGLDQSVSLFAEAGNALLLDFADHSRTQVPLALGPARMAFLVIDTTVSHALVDEGGYAARRADCEEAACRLGVPSLREVTVGDLARLDDPVLLARARHVVTEIQRVQDTVQALADHDWDEVGRLFVASHASLRDDYQVSCEELDEAVSAALAAGALGARMTGGGFGGSAVAVVPSQRLSQLVTAVSEAFAGLGFAPPQLLVAEPSAGAGPC